MTGQITPPVDEQPWQRDLDRLNELHLAYRCLGRYLAARARPGPDAVDGLWLGTWVMKLGADIHSDAVQSHSASATPWNPAAKTSPAPTTSPDRKDTTS